MKEQPSVAYSLISLLKKVIVGFIILIAFIICGFLYYINQTDYSDDTTIDATGVYNLLDSEGNVIATDLTAEDIKKIVEMLNNGTN